MRLVRRAVAEEEIVSERVIEGTVERDDFRESNGRNRSFVSDALVRLLCVRDCS